jgi:hypothetical protein
MEEPWKKSLWKTAVVAMGKCTPSQPRALLLLFMFRISKIPAPFLQAHRSLLPMDPLDDYYCPSSEIFSAGSHSEHTWVELLL